MDTDLICPICFNTISLAHIAPCGHSFCYQCISRQIEINKKCPKCNKNLTRLEDIIPNLALNEIILKSQLQQKLEKNESLENKFGADSTLRNMLSNNIDNLSLADIDSLLQVLRRKQKVLEHESESVQNELLMAFLTRLLASKMETLKQTQQEVAMIENDITSVKSFLEASSSKQGGADDLSNEQVVVQRIETEADEQPIAFNHLVQDGASYSKLSTRKNRVFSHFDDFADSYFYCKNQHKTAIENESFDEEFDSGLDEFRQSLAKFSKYRELRCLATLSYSNDFSLASTIVSSVEFDKDSEFFAVAGVTKRIKIFDFYSAIKDALVDIKYPIYEMSCNSKVSCVSWNSYLKEVLACSDYEGIVTIWDVQTGSRTQEFQEHDKRCWSVDFNEIDTRLLVSGSDDARIKFWSLNVQHSVSTLEAKANVCCVKFNPSSSVHLATGSADHNVHYYDLRFIREPLCVLEGHKKAVSYVKFLNANEIISAGTDGQLKLWDITKSSKAACVRTFYGHINEKNFVGLATNGDYIACGSEDNSLTMYFKDVSKKLFSYKFTDDMSISSNYEPVNLSDGNEFVSAVCWRKSNDVIMAGNSKGIIKILELH